MNKAFLLLPLLLLASCSTSSLNYNDHSGAGDLDDGGRALGNWTLFSDNNNSVFAKGSYLDGKPHGLWEIWDNAGVKNADLDFDYGQYTGTYTLYYTGYTPEATGMVKTIGHAHNGEYSGDFTRYNPDGSVLVKYTALNNSVTTVEQGLRLDAEQQLAADMGLLNVYQQAILKAPAKANSTN